MKQITVRFSLILVTSLFCLLSSANNVRQSHFFQNIIVVTVDVKGKATIGKDTFDMDGLTQELQQRFWKSYLGTDKMQDKVRLEYTGNVSSTYRKNAIAAIKKAQQGALVDLCLQLHKKKYEDLSAKQQQKIKTKYPILFQQNFTE